MIARLKAEVRRRPLVSFFVLAFALTWALVLLSRLSLVFGFLGLFGPALAAVIVAAIADGATGVRALLGKVLAWRASPVWYLIAAGLPFVLTAAAAGLHLLLGGEGPFPLAPIGVVSLVLAIMVVGEEIGWRGYALPKLIDRYGPIGASLILGILWAAWHLANATIPGLERYWTAFPAFLLFVIAQTFLFTWIALNTRGSVLFAWIFHAAINTAGAVFLFTDPVRQWWFSGIVFAIAASVWVVTWTRSRAPHSRPRAAKSR